MQHPTGSKTVSASWVKNEFGLEWRALIEKAEQWQYGREIGLKDQTISFMKFVVKTISATTLANDICN